MEDKSWWNMGDIENYVQAEVNVDWEDDSVEPVMPVPIMEEQGLVTTSDLEFNRDVIMDGIHQLLVEQNLQGEGSGVVRCLFSEHGCRKKFQDRNSMMAHVPDCLSGAFRYCKEDDCLPEHGKIADSLYDFVSHAMNHHELTNSLGSYEPEAIQLCLDERDLFPNPKGYSVKLLKSQRLSNNPRVLLAVVVQDVDGPDKRVMIVPMLYTDPVFLVEVECTLRGRNGKVIHPLAYPGFELEKPCPPSIRSYAFHSINDFVDAASYLDGVVSYSLMEILKQAAINDGPYPKLLSLDVRMRGFRCIISEETAFSPLTPALGWEGTRISQEVQRTMDDGSKDYPSFETRIILPQLRGHADFIIECAKPKPAVNAIITGIVEHVRKEVFDNERATPVRAIIFYSTVTMIRRYQKKWKRRAKAVRASVFVLDSTFANLREQLLRHGADILLTTPHYWHELVRTTEEPFVQLLVNQMKFIVFHRLEKYCGPETIGRLERDIGRIPTEAARTIKIGFLERMESGVRQQILTSHGGTPLFHTGWNKFSIGQDPEHVITDMNIIWEEYDNVHCKIDKVLTTIARYPPMRWLIFANRCRGTMTQCELLTEALEGVVRSRDLTVVWKESYIFTNRNFWDPFSSSPTSVMLGPYFLLDFGECMECDGVIMFDQPVHRADVVRVGNIVLGIEGERKTCIGFRRID